ncbi:TetR family transcriptional regulator [Paenibacillus sp. IB182496]|uniref:TetR family transcriptional regulator n=2 Tax=Paenibacillus sabuli TaxID=2772509 RepID=A0A927GQ83_9BACL|nr:TetR family transcriptional regulator [Paenibacillus sabuli]
MHKPSLREIKKEATAHALAEAAFELARERGLDGFVVEDVVQRAGYSRRTFANHFACKEEAVAVSAISFVAFDDAEHVLDELPEESTPLDVLQQLLQTQFTAALLRKLHELVLLAERYPTLEPYILNVFRSLQRAALETLEALFAERYPPGYCHMIVGAIYGAVMPVVEGLVEVPLPGRTIAYAADAPTFEQYLDAAFGYLKRGF